ncbi:Glutathione hydrolase proenzyme [Vanrija pseudolonga]|uniref:Glutathione hydrolase n=1 Tax=Vanrija pseudolonga TaxID=143232 RepID=A0AAF1BKI6_9TREE|nr:Glutathione hydrolase proenzyme [Vanrija pseudolonga]
MLPLVLAPLLLALAHAAPVEPATHTLNKRWNTCSGYNVAGCPFASAGEHGAVATEIGTCSAIGVQALKDGGSAADAIIAASLCVGVISNWHSGIGGGGFLINRFTNKDGSKGYEQIDFRETAPAGSNETMYSQYGVNQTKSTKGGLAVGVPGEIRAWEALHKRHGKLPWKRLFEPSIDIARHGFPVNYDLATVLTPAYPFLTSDPIWAEQFAPNGTLLKQGDYVYRHRLADALTIIAKKGPDAFYHGRIAKNIVKAAQAQGGIITLKDLAGYKVNVKNTSVVEYRGKRIYSTTAPSSGVVVLSTLKIFEGFPDGGAADDSPAINLTTHYLVEADKLGYGQRATLGDPAFTANVTALEASYLTEPVIKAARARIHANTTFPPPYYNPDNYFPSREGGTSHLAAVDKDGNAVSLTTTVNLIWGSGVITEDGIVLNNEMDDFSSPGQVNAFGFPANPINFIKPGKRPQSSIASSLVEDEHGNLVFVTGSAGGSRIITATLQQLHNYVDKGLNATGSTYHPRWHDQLSGKTFFDYDDPSRPIPLKGYDNGTVAYFTSLGYNITYQSPFGSSTSHAISKLPNGQWLAAADPRRPTGWGQAY